MTLPRVLTALALVTFFAVAALAADSSRPASPPAQSAAPGNPDKSAPAAPDKSAPPREQSRREQSAPAPLFTPSEKIRGDTAVAFPADI